MSHLNQNAIHCINPECPRPYPQLWGNKFCNSCGAPLQLLDRYIPLQPLGSGGFAQIYTVWDCKTQTEKVLKVLIESSPKALELFSQEAAVLARLRHPGVPKVEADGFFHIETLQTTSPQSKPSRLHCLVMEKISGQTLEELFQQHSHGCPQDLVLNWLAQAVDILQELHSRKIIHRDIKPSNLMLRSSHNKGGTKADRLVLIDFGGAKQVSYNLFRNQSSSTRLYSTGYSPPEQIAGGVVGAPADFYALGRTMIEMLTGKSLTELANPATGELFWRSGVNVSPQLADLLDDMIQEDVRSRPANAAIVKKRLSKISQLPQPSVLSQIGKSVHQGLGQAGSLLSQVEDSLGKALSRSTQAAGKTTFFLVKTIVSVILACLDTLWTMILTGVGASLGAIAGFLLASQITLDDYLAQFLSERLFEATGISQIIFGSEILLFIGAGLGTAWGLTIAGGFGQRRRFVVASVMSVISYGFGWLILQLMTPQSIPEGLVGLVLGTVSLLSLGLGLRSHHIVYAFIAAFGTAIVFAFLVMLGFPTNIFNFFNSPSLTEILLPVIFFSFMGVVLSFWLGISHYLIVPGLRFLGWK
ncbi:MULTISPECIES: serine/threonine protein kinase [Nostocales]|uniref:non-specific serine/threonine protein kinase n=3 Tax=Nostocales TaxID=1161 RepID=A0A0C1N780_9CYAN|nr:serine/threonine-protein kinase [Tolypothrix bouteillei]KAF3883728.1 serine/threonine protein kinase [Tolypothrix bouteillei VB521301]